MIFQAFHLPELYLDCVQDAPNSRPIGVGEAVPFCHERGILSDDVGPRHISHLNVFVSEWTVVYWIWQNLDNELVGENSWVGVGHYRRAAPFLLLRDTKLADALFLDCDMVAWRPMYGSFAAHTETHHPGLMDTLFGELSKVESPQSIQEIQAFSNATCIHPYANCFAMQKELYRDYCQWSWRIVEPLFALAQSDSPVVNGFDLSAPRNLAFFCERLAPVFAFCRNLRVLFMNGPADGTLYDPIYASVPSHRSQVERDAE